MSRPTWYQLKINGSWNQFPLQNTIFHEVARANQFDPPSDTGMCRRRPLGADGRANSSLHDDHHVTVEEPGVQTARRSPFGSPISHHDRGGLKVGTASTSTSAMIGNGAISALQRRHRRHFELHRRTWLWCGGVRRCRPRDALPDGGLGKLEYRNDPALIVRRAWAWQQRTVQLYRGRQDSRSHGFHNHARRSTSTISCVNCFRRHGPVRHLPAHPQFTTSCPDLSVRSVAGV